MTSPAEIGPSEELRHAIAMVVDVAGSTEIAQRLGTERSFALMRELVGLATAAVQDQRGHALSFTGDGIFALFGAPVAVEKAALRACTAALAICRAVEDSAEDMERRFGLRPRIRIGLASGEVLIGSVSLGDAATINAGGPAIALAQRIQSLAPEGAVAFSDDIVASVTGDAEFAPLGPHALKGFAEQHTLWRLTRLARQASLGGGAFIGRDQDLAALLDWLPQGSGGAALCLVQGPPGIGKSRIVAEVARSVAPGRKLVLGACFAESGTRPMAVLFDILRAATSAEGGLRLAQLLSEDAADSAALRDYMERGITPRPDMDYGEAVRLRRELVRAIQALAGLPDRLVVIEDLHWIDSASVQVLAEALGRAGSDLRILATTRPVDDWRWLHDLHPRVLRLAPLEPQETALLAGSVPGAAGLSPQFLNLVVEKAEGNPFFAVELARHLLQSSAATADPASAGSVQNLAFARFDRLDSDTRNALRLAAVLGRSFPLAALEAAQVLPRSGRADFLDRTQGLVVPDLVHPETHGAFSHVLWRDVILHSLPEARRIALHRQAGEAIEAIAGPDSEQFASALLDHFERAGDIARALPHFLRAAGQAYRLFALPIADRLAERALDLVATHPDAAPDSTFGELILLFLRLLEDQGHYERIIQANLRWAHRLAAADLARIRVTAMALHAKSLCHKAEFAASVELVEKAAQQAQDLGLQRELAFVRVMMMRIVIDSGLRPSELVKELYDQTAEIAQSGQDVQLARLRAYHWVAHLRALGQLPLAMAANQALYDLAERHKDLASRVNADWSKGLIYAWGSNHPGAEQAALACLENVVVGTAHHRVAVSTLNSARMSMGQVVDPDIFLRLAEECRVNSEANSRIAQQFNVVVAFLKLGRIREARRQFRLLADQVETIGNVELKKLGRMGMVEIELAVAGAMPSAGPKPRLALPDALAGLAWRLGAIARCKRNMAICLKGSLTGEDYFAARSLVGLALAERRSGAPDKAAALEAEARRVCALQDLPYLAARLDGAAR